MYVNSHGATPQYPSKSSFTYKNTKYDLYNDLIDDGLEINDQLLTDVRKGDINGLLKVAYVYDEEAKRCNRKSLEWALLAAIKECPEAQLKVASMLHSGPPGIKEDYNLAMEWYLQAAKNGNVDALNSIECMYKHSLIDLQHSITAKERFLKASKHGASSSVHKIGGDQEHGVARETPINIKRLSANLHGFQQDICRMSTTISQSQTTFENAVEKLSELEHFFLTKLREIEQRESDSHRKRSREPEHSDDDDDDENRISKKRYKHKKFSYRWMNHFTVYQS